MALMAHASVASFVFACDFKKKTSLKALTVKNQPFFFVFHEQRNTDTLTTCCHFEIPTWIIWGTLISVVQRHLPEKYWTWHVLLYKKKRGFKVLYLCSDNSKIALKCDFFFYCFINLCFLRWWKDEPAVLFPLMTVFQLSFYSNRGRRGGGGWRQYVHDHQQTIKNSVEGNEFVSTRLIETEVSQSRELLRMNNSIILTFS